MSALGFYKKYFALIAQWLWWLMVSENYVTRPREYIYTVTDCDSESAHPRLKLSHDQS